MTMATAQEVSEGRKTLQSLETAIGTLGLINEHGDLCRDGLRAVNHMKSIAFQLLKAIEADEGVDVVADELHKAHTSIDK